MTETITVIYEEKEFIVDFYYQPEEKADRGPEAYYPGCAASIEIEDITCVDLDRSLMYAVETLNLLEEFEQLVWDEMENQREY